MGLWSDFCEWLLKRRTETKAPTKDRIVLVGINSYPSCPLQGCVNDVLNMKQFLLENHIDPDSIRTLLDRDANTKNIRELLTWMREASPGGIALYHESGHGVQVPDTSPNSTEPDKLLEAFCPVDFDWSREHMLTDKDFYSLFWEIEDAVKFYWVSDSCHSGDLDRTITRARMMPLPPHMVEMVRKLRQKVPSRPILSREQAKQLDVGYISACRSDQTAADAFIDGKPCGAFTYYFVKALRQYPQDLLEETRAKATVMLQANGYNQIPQTDGPRVLKRFLT